MKKLISIDYRRRIIIIIVGAIIAITSLIVTGRMAEQLRSKEKNEVALWSYAMCRVGEIEHTNPMLTYIVNTRNNIPFIVTNETLKVESSHLIPENIIKHPDKLRTKLEQMASENQPLEVQTWTGETFYIFFESSNLLKTLVYFPFVQIGVIAIFVLFGFITVRTSKQDEQNRVWIGLAKETAHQLGTPTSSLLGWVEYLREQHVDQQVVDEMNKDVIRLMKIVERFSKIGSETILSEGVVNELVSTSVSYFRSRIPRNVTLDYNGLAMAPLSAMVNPSLFEWVIENLLKNSLDAMQGVGALKVTLSHDATNIYIDVKDSGKGIAKNNFKRIFEPGFTTKTRGWGLGLSLSRRIINDYHKGHIYVYESEIDKGTTIRVELKKLYA
ncbi:MAG: HAMP domain-containing sensor histidine kinase [Rikenellaceae bacterium]